MDKGLVTNVTRVALSCTCLLRIIHEDFYDNGQCSGEVYGASRMLKKSVQQGHSE